MLRRPDPQIAAVVEARHSDPFSFLGMHETDGGVSVRAILPGVQDVSVIESATGQVAAKAVQVHRDGFFVGTIPDRKEAFRYRLRVTSGGAQHEFYDVYSFRPALGEIDIHLLAEGNHLASYRKLGAHPLVHEGVEGVPEHTFTTSRARRQRRSAPSSWCSR